MWVIKTDEYDENKAQVHRVSSHYYFVKAMGWGRGGGGGRSVYSRHLYILGCGGGGCE